jgi:hypothetical protein
MMTMGQALTWPTFQTLSPEPNMSYQIIQIQNTPHLERTPITQGDVEDILTLLGFPKTDISKAKITVLPSGVTVHWTAKTCEAP